MNSMATARERRDQALQIAQNHTWRIWVQDYSVPNRLHVSRDEVDDEENLYISFTQVCETLHLDLDALSQIFVKKPQQYYQVPPQDRPIQQRASSYQELGYLRVWDDSGWQALSELTGRVIEIIDQEDDPYGAVRGRMWGIYRPGKPVIHP